MWVPLPFAGSDICLAEDILAQLRPHSDWPTRWTSARTIFPNTRIMTKDKLMPISLHNLVDDSNILFPRSTGSLCRVNKIEFAWISSYWTDKANISKRKPFRGCSDKI